MICPNCQSKFSGFKMGKERIEHIIQCGHCQQILIPTKNSYTNLQKNKYIGLSVAGLLYIIIVFIGNKLLINFSNLYFYFLIIIVAILMSKVFFIFYKKQYESIISFEHYNQPQQNKFETN